MSINYTHLSKSGRALAGGLFISISGVLMSSCAAGGWQTPPIDLIDDADVTVSFQSSDKVNANCGDIGEQLSGRTYNRIYACAYKHETYDETVLIAPNPCEYDGAYASLLCHELAHINQVRKGLSAGHDGWGTYTQTALLQTDVPKLRKEAKYSKGSAIFEFLP